MRFTFRHILLSALLPVFACGCIREDLSECDPGVLLKYDYSLNPEYSNLFGEEVDKVTVFVFDDKGLYYDCFTDEGKHLANDWEMRLPLPPGDYTTVTWGGTLGSYRIGQAEADGSLSELSKGVTDIDNFILSAEKDGQPLTKLDKLYHGKAKVTSVYQPKDAVVVPLMHDTHILTVTVEDPGISVSSIGAPYEVSLAGANGRYLADNSFGKEAYTMTYLPYEVHTEPGKAVSELDILRLYVGRPAHLGVKDRQGRVVFDGDLVDVIMATGHYATQEDLDRERRFDIVIRTGTGPGGESGITVSVNGWVAVFVIPEL